MHILRAHSSKQQQHLSDAQTCESEAPWWERGDNIITLREQEKMTSLITKIIAKDVLPVSFVEGEGFQGHDGNCLAQVLSSTKETSCKTREALW